MEKEKRLKEKKRKLHEMVAIEQKEMGEEEDMIKAERKKLADKKERNKKQAESEATARSSAVVGEDQVIAKRARMISDGDLGKEGKKREDSKSDRSAIATIDPSPDIELRTELITDQSKSNNTTKTGRTQASTSSPASTTARVTRSVAGKK